MVLERSPGMALLTTASISQMGRSSESSKLKRRAAMLAWQKGRFVCQLFEVDRITTANDHV